MRFANAITLAALLSTTSAAPKPAYDTDALAAQGAAKLEAYLAKHGYPNAQKCNKSNTVVRKEWSTLTPAERIAYTDAVKCLAEKPAKTPSSIASGAKNRYDDFVATHINQTLSIHGTGNFLSWHRYFTWSYEQVLRTECGYRGKFPYYSWPWWASDPASSPTFDGSPASMSGDGEYVANRSNTCIPSTELCQISLPPGRGGGCVKKGPFKDWQVNLGPVAPALQGVSSNPEPSGLGYNPRCLRRDISQYASSRWSTDASVSSLITQYPTFLNFSTIMQGNFAAGFLGVHTAGHFTIGGDPGGDLFASPGDPAFFLHHAMIDRVWWIWQNQDLEKRLYALGGTITLNNMPPSRNTTLEDTIDLGYVGSKVVTIREASSTLGGPFCYTYQ